MAKVQNKMAAKKFELSTQNCSQPEQREVDLRYIRALGRGLLRVMDPSTGRTKPTRRYFATTLPVSGGLEQPVGYNAGRWVDKEQALEMFPLEPHEREKHLHEGLMAHHDRLKGMQAAYPGDAHVVGVDAA
jgi:hypothetical protein